MINRELIRLKTLQLVYAYYRSGGTSPDEADRQLSQSLAMTYELYEYLLNLLVELRLLAEERTSIAYAKARRLGMEATVPPELFFAKNQMLRRLEENEKLAVYRSDRHVWSEEPVMQAHLLEKMLGSDIYKAYCALPAEERDYNADRELVRRLYKTYVCNNETIDELLEDHGLYWNDDKEIIDSFVLKTIKRIWPDTPVGWPLLPEYDSTEDRLFAETLFAATLNLTDETRTLIRENCRNWEFDRLAFMDVVIMQQALAEILTFPDIPVRVTFNEYINLAKVYSSHRSAPYINGLLDHIVKKLRAEGRIMK